MAAEIKNRFSGEVICTGETIRGAAIENRAYLRGADLRGADLSGADLSGAKFAEGSHRAKICFQSHDLIAEILRRAAGDDVEKLKIAGFILLCREKCWREFLAIRDPLTDWALDVLLPWAEGDEDAPDVLKTKE